eukprot:CAMPEP_0197613084 /NCGR_PEP_ID=MMETSP1326-20131121/58531_1 /TAXON_ID=1155430 /ORGANISM="Genus nov. species nov., Strain RCC2288" /LENGTH=65 /DNA_ID=CAMNT_0043181919 /DNA_START=36 /DNA_END=230 /DNA_ORIENTATION=-
MSSAKKATPTPQKGPNLFSFFNKVAEKSQPKPDADAGAAAAAFVDLTTDGPLAASCKKAGGAEAE